MEKKIEKNVYLFKNIIDKKNFICMLIKRIKIKKSLKKRLLKMLTYLYKNIFFKKISIYLIVLSLFFCSTIFLFWIRSIKTYETKKISYLSQSIEYEKILKITDIKKSSTIIQANDFIKKNQNIYGTFTAMFLAKKYILDNQFTPALMQLKNSLKYTKEENLHHLLLWKIAEIYKEQNNKKDTINTLKKIKDHNWNNIIENIRGDIFLAMNNKKEAIKSWENSKLTENSHASKEIIDMKIQDLK